MKIDLLILAISPVLECLLWIYLKDRYEKEPLNVLLKFFILGVLVSGFSIIIEKFLVDISNFSGYSYIFYMSFIVAALTEEGIKALILIPVLLKEKHFNEKLDGIIYSVFLSLGFATIENIIYLFFEDINFAYEVGLTRAIISIPAHIIFAINMGYYVSKYRFNNKNTQKKQYIIRAILVPVLIHGLFDFILMIQYRWAIIVFIAYIVFLWKISLDKLDEYTDNSRKRFFRRRKRKDDNN